LNFIYYLLVLKLCYVLTLLVWLQNISSLLLSSNSTAFSHKPNPDKPKNYDNNTHQWIRWKSCNSYYYYYDGNAIVYAFFKSHLLTIYRCCWDLIINCCNFLVFTYDSKKYDKYNMINLNRWDSLRVQHPPVFTKIVLYFIAHI
jgi:hypothetical protein